MELSYLIYFRTVARTEHISQAAEILHLTQPALSRAISRVEETVGTPLFERGPNRIRLNHAGRLFLRRVEQILSEYDDAIREVTDSSAAETGSVKLIAPTLELVSGFLRQYLPQHPNMQVFHQLAGSEYMLHQLETHGADFALCPAPEGAVRVTWTPLYREEYRLCVGIGHPLASKTAIPLSAAAGEKFIFNHGTSSFAGQMQSVCRQAGFEPRVFFMGDETDFTLDLAAGNLAVLFLPATMTDPRQNPRIGQYRDSLRFLEITDPDCSRTIGIARLTDGYLTNTGKAAMEALRDYYRSLAGIPGFAVIDGA